MTGSQLKILQVASGDSWGGAESQLYSLCLQLKEVSHSVDCRVVLLNNGELSQKLESAGIEVIIIDENKFNSFQILKRLNTVVRKYQPHLLHSHREKENVIGSIAAKLNGIKSIRSVHGAPEHLASWFKPHKRLIPLLNRWTGQLFQERIVSVSKELTSKLHSDFSHAKVDTIENGVDINTLISSANSPENKFKQESLNIGIVGRLVPVKRVDRFINAAALALGQNPNVEFQFHIYGAGPLRAELESLALQHSIKSKINFHGHTTQIHSQIAMLDILLITSDHEGLPMTLLESMYLGTPVICSPVGAIPSVLDNGNYGALVSNISSESFAAAITYLINNQQQVIETAKKAIIRVKEKYTSSTNARSFIKLYSQLTGVYPEKLNNIVERVL